MTLDVPRRPGFTAGTEEPVWQGSPALRSTLYMWLISLGAGWFISLIWGKLFNAFLQYGLLPPVPGITNALYTSSGELALWFRMVPWAVVLMPVFWYTINLAVTTYELSTQRITVRSGIMVRTMDQVELFRVRDFMIDAPFYFAILGLAHVRVISRDESLPLLTMIAQPQPDQLVNLIRTNTQRRKDEVGMREIETNTA